MNTLYTSSSHNLYYKNLWKLKERRTFNYQLKVLLSLLSIKTKASYASDIPFAKASKKIKMDNKTKNIPLDIILNHTTLEFLVFKPKTKATIKPISITKYRRILMVKFAFGNNLEIKKTRIEAIIKRMVKIMGSLSFRVLMISLLLTK